MANCRDEEVCVNTEGAFRCQPRDEPTPTCRQGYIYDKALQSCVPDQRLRERCPEGYAYNTLTDRCEGMLVLISQRLIEMFGQNLWMKMRTY